MNGRQKSSSLSIARALSTRDIFNAYFELTKPGITLMVVVTAAAGFYLGLPKDASMYLTMHTSMLFLGTVAGTALVSAGSCALNHVIERGFDAEMKRTMHRPIPSGRIRPDAAAWFGLVLSAAGLGILSNIHWLTAALAAVTSLLYLAVYTPMKRKTPLSTLVGAIPGALPPLGGWIATHDAAGAGGVILFLVLFLWQMPHFYALAWMYRRDYERGGFAMATVYDETGIATARTMIAYSALLLLVSLALTWTGVAGIAYFAGALLLGTAFLFTVLRFSAERSSARARAVLIVSYLYLLTLITLMFVDRAIQSL
jgi:heme o synthase